MSGFFQLGGWVMWFVLLFGSLSTAAAIAFAMRAEPKRLAMVRALTAVTVFSSLSGMFADFLQVSRYVVSHEELATNNQLGIIVITGLGESLTPGILGFSLLAISWLVVAVGTRRAEA